MIYNLFISHIFFIARLVLFSLFVHFNIKLVFMNIFLGVKFYMIVYIKDIVSFCPVDGFSKFSNYFFELENSKVLS